ncbi:uncharacterized protein LOC114873665 [Osmia bicornis bicornis]|uniref:uncharacterized protein LOC114873665 n=1 Tax=Osmia bicornis bicornis TaxID=1437191 RepID=UPI001EAEFFE2|nr:uncharacterized protein LOC114873665 [Osmia bicornis bicornis]
MKHVQTLGYVAVVLCIATLAIGRCESKRAVDANRTKVADFEGAVNHDEDEDDFVPYQGERFNVFDWTLFKVMSKRYDENLLLSPISLKIALVLLYEGAQENTAHELAAGMQLPATRTATRDKFSTILRSLQTTSPAYSLNIGTRIYTDSNILIRQRYEAIVKTFYNTDVIVANMSDSQPLVREINRWVSNVTEGNIEKIIEDESSVKESLMLIVNALYFKGSWRRRYFPPENTRVGKFYKNGNESIDVPFMRAFGRFYFSESPELDAKILRIPYDGHKYAMYLLLPRTQNGIEQLVADVNPFILARHMWLMQDLPVDVSIPKFKFEFSSHLESVLRQLGIRNIFDDTATLTGIARTKRTSKHLKVSNILQKAGIEVNENGTTAYVATEIELGNKIGEETFHANRPFLFYIEDESTGTITYMGKIMNPLIMSGSTGRSNQTTLSKFGTPVVNADSNLQMGFNAEDRNNLFNAYFSQVLSKEHDENLVSSPASVKAILTMLMEGANGKTRQEILSELRLPNEESRIREITQRTYVSLKRKENGTEIDLATRLWIDENLHVLDSYKNILQSHYRGDVQNINFIDSQKTARLINDWVRQATRSVVSSPLVNNIQPDTRMILTSIIYFKGCWLKAFDPMKTGLQCFYVPNGECKKTHFMQHKSTYRYAYISSIEAHILEIPYSDGKTSMLTIMPNEREKDPHLRILSKDLATIPISAILANLRERDVTIYLPKFKIENNLNLMSTLQNLGIESIFRFDANLTNIVSNGSVRVTDILQKIKVEIDEEGTLAAADTEVGYQLLSSWSNDVKMDRPFLFLIIDSITNTSLFFGRFIEPL